MKTLSMFYLVIYSAQKVDNDSIFLCSIVLPPVGHSSNNEYHCWNLQTIELWFEFYRTFKVFSWLSFVFGSKWRNCQEGGKYRILSGFVIFIAQQVSLGWTSEGEWNDGYVAWMGEKRNICRLLAGKLDGCRQMGRTWRRRGNNIKMGIKEIGRQGVEWTDLAQDWEKWRVLWTR